MFGMLDMAVHMANSTHHYIEYNWKREALLRDGHYLNMTMSSTEQHLTWSEVSNRFPEHSQMAWNIAKLACRCSNSKSDRVMYKGTRLSNRACENCELFQEGNLKHLVLHSPNDNDIREKMMLDLCELERGSNSDFTGTGELNPIGKKES